MNKGIVLCNQVAGPMFVDLANHCISQNMDVDLITGSIEETYSKLDKRVNVILKKKYKRTNAFWRVYTWVIFFIQSYFILQFQNKNKEVLLVSNPPILPIIGLFLYLTKKTNFKVLIYDIYPNALSELNILSEKSFIYRIWDWLNTLTYNRASEIISISNSMKSELEKKYKLKKIKVIYPWTDNSFIKPIKKGDNWFSKKHKLDKKIVALYSGNMGKTHNLLTILETAKILSKNEKYHFLFIGDGSEKSKLVEYKEKNNLGNVTFLPYQKSKILPYSITSGDYGIISLGSGIENMSLPSKTFYQLAAGNALISVTEKDSEIDKMVSKNNCGISVKPNESNKLANELLKIDKDILLQMKDNARKISFKFTMRNVKEFF